MTSLEFIEKEIKNAKELLQRLEKLKVNSNKYELQLNEVLEKDTQEKLFYLYQIKAKLEAWEIVKSKEVDLYDVIHTTDYEQYKLENEDLLEQYILDQLEYETIKKALEVEE